MAHQTFYVTRDQRHPLYRTRMLTAGQELNLSASAARLFGQLGVEMSEEMPRKAQKAVAETPAPAEQPAPDPSPPPAEAPKATAKRPAPKRKKATAKKTK